MEQCIVRYSIWKNGVLAMIGFVLSVLLLLAFLANPNSSVPWGAGLFFGSIALLFGFRVVDRRPRLIIDERGITDNRRWVGFIPWKEIAKIDVVGRGRGDVVRINLLNTDQWWVKLPIIYRISWKLFPNWRIISIPLQNMDIPTSTIRAFLQKLNR